MAAWEDAKTEAHLRSVIRQPSKHIDAAVAYEEKVITALTPAQSQQLQQESSSLLKEYASLSEALTTTESNITEISRLQATLAFHLTNQNALIGRLWDDAVLIGDTVKRGNLELERAKQRSSGSFRNAVIAVILLLALMLLFLHFYSS